MLQGRILCQVFGYDFLVDSLGEPVLIEVSAAPLRAVAPGRALYGCKGYTSQRVLGLDGTLGYRDIVGAHRGYAAGDAFPVPTWAACECAERR